MPSPPNDLTIARTEIHPYHDSSGNLITPRKESAVHYHCHIWCIKVIEPLFVPSALRVPVDIYNQLTPMHCDYLQRTFGMYVTSMYVASMYLCSLLYAYMHVCMLLICC